MTEQPTTAPSATQCDEVDPSYLAERRLGRGTAGWPQLAGLGIVNVVTGLYAVWNYGIGAGGWGGMVVALAVMAVLYFCLVFSLAELATLVPTAGGGYGFARRALGPLAGYVVGVAFIVQYNVAIGVLALFFGAYFHSLTGIASLWVAAMLYSVAVAIHILKAEDSLALTLVLAVAATLGLALFVICALPAVSLQHLLDIPADRTFAGASALLPHGWSGIWLALPYAMAMFMGVEAVPLAAEEARNPRRDLPRGMIVAITTLFIASLLVLIVGPGSAGAARIAASPAPIMVALDASGFGGSFIHVLVSIAGLVSIGGTFFALLFATSRQLYALSRAGYLPRFLSRTNRAHSPYAAVLAVATAAIPFTLLGEASQLVVVSFACGALCYMLLMVSHLALRLKEPTLDRPYVTPGGIVTSAIAFVLSLVVLGVSLSLSPVMTAGSGIAIALFILYFQFYARHHIVHSAPEETGLA